MGKLILRVHYKLIIWPQKHIARSLCAYFMGYNAYIQDQYSLILKGQYLFVGVIVQTYDKSSRQWQGESWFINLTTFLINSTIHQLWIENVYGAWNGNYVLKDTNPYSWPCSPWVLIYICIYIYIYMYIHIYIYIYTYTYRDEVSVVSTHSGRVTPYGHIVVGRDMLG